MTEPTRNLRDLGRGAQPITKHRGYERLAMTRQFVDAGFMIVMAGATVAHVIKSLLLNTNDRGRSK